MIRSGRTTAAVVALFTTMLLGLLSVGEGAHADDSSGGAGLLGERHLPTAVNAPGEWAGSADVRWPVAAVGIATRTEPVGLFDELTRLAPFAVSAIDGSATWLRLPGHSVESWGMIGGFTVSPDGSRIGWVRAHQSRSAGVVQRIAGWSVLDTATGEVTRLAVPGQPWVRATMADLAFSGDSRFLLTSYEKPSSPKGARSRSHQLVAWDVEDGAPTVIEGPGRYWLPSLGTAPTGVTWARGQDVFRVDPDSGERRTLTLPRDVVAASWGPDDTGFAYIGGPAGKKGPWRLYAGETVAEARDSAIDLPPRVRPAQLLGWRDRTHVVVGHYRSTVHVVDIVSGEVEALDLAGAGEQINTPTFATALWQQPLIAPAEQQGTSDPRTPWLWAGAVLVILLGAALLVVWRRARSADRANADQLPDTPPPSLRPLVTVAAGLLLVMVDLRYNGFDLLHDPVGLVMAAVALSSLRPVHHGFRVAGLAAWLAVIPAVLDMIGGEGLPITLSMLLAILVLEVATCTAIMDTCPARASSARTIRTLSIGLTGVLLLSPALVALDQSFVVVLVGVGLVTLAVAVWFLVLLYVVAMGVGSEASAHQLAQ